MAVSAFVLSAFSCCKALQLSSSEFNELPDITIHSKQHGRDTAVRFSFANLLAFPHVKTCGVARCFQEVSEGDARQAERLLIGLASRPVRSG
jgi:hypothetical protein